MVDILEAEEQIDQITAEIFKEFDSALAKHGPLPTDIFQCLAIIGEEFGEAQKSALEHNFVALRVQRGQTSVGAAKINMIHHKANLRKELIQVAAMCISTIIHHQLKPL